MEQALTTEIRNAVAKRRTFAIISHPDAGKTTLTEKLLLYSGMIQTAGMVRGRKGGKVAVSDWMGMEQERGISITASAMQFPYKNAIINVLDTPGHQDFSEDTYRTLTAADCAIMVIDAAKGVETQTRKLFEVCRLRGIPVMTFMNKMDLPGRDPLELMEEVENVLGIHSSAMNWPVGSGREFVGVVERSTQELILFAKKSVGGAAKAGIEKIPLSSPEAKTHISEELWEKLQHDMELLEVAGNPYNHEEFLKGKVTPVFFASALTNFGVETFFDAFVDMAPPPGPRLADTPEGEILIDPVETPFSAYIFKLQANMNPKHRDSTAFMRICSGRFERDVVVKNHRLGKDLRLSQPHTMLAADRTTLNYAYPGDIVGVINPGVFAIGDTISLKGGFNFKPLPSFQPEIFAHIRPKNVEKRKPFDKGVAQMTAEGTVQMLSSWDGLDFYVAAVGRLQFDVLQYRLKAEYGVETVLETLPYQCSAWLVGDPDSFDPPVQVLKTRDRMDRPVVLFRTTWDKDYTAKKCPDHQFLDMA
ncbi:MAG TPA: peptide chain release factor 3 [bacterium]|nr:peptide chain release factor 3 [bacterium]